MPKKHRINTVLGTLKYSVTVLQYFMVWRSIFHRIARADVPIIFKQDRRIFLRPINTSYLTIRIRFHEEDHNLPHFPAQLLILDKNLCSAPFTISPVQRWRMALRVTTIVPGMGSAVTNSPLGLFTSKPPTSSCTRKENKFAR